VTAEVAGSSPVRIAAINNRSASDLSLVEAG
ncbi:MAG: hypothetical protein RIS19_949, partial [Actinomycetota bacterium]